MGHVKENLNQGIIIIPNHSDHEYENDTELSKHIWRLKDDSREYRVIWSIERTARPYKCGTKRCDLCHKSQLKWSFK